ncbi:MAG: SgcJ/EcaC family oxidoreductase [Actinophytocola sp.]|uniref:SgcJ/EcaC family oxidoreductase n=1 Tax=Actinophytocola sp. TaxID=1872138 RepID=UPI0013226AE8|nr:SgcJ/EcaC family oxidoreductase [Actinophytocola sp.]MPZ81588.1 SgcJ/EcaC family oxidoreductase [Actinophytocola sp.]
MDTEHPDIERVVAALAHTQQNEQVDAFVALFREDAIWTTGHGRLLTGRAEIAAFTRQVLPGAMKDTTATYEVVHALFIRPDVAAVKVRQVVTTAGERSEGTPMFVMSEEDGRWLLVACQNTSVLAG